MEIEQEPGTFVSGARARWLIQARRAQAAGPGKLRLLDAPAPSGAGQRTAPRHEERAHWSSYSSAGARNLSGKPWLKGYHMNGAAMNRAAL